MVLEPLNLVKLKGRRLSLARSWLYKNEFPGKPLKGPKLILDMKFDEFIFVLPSFSRSQTPPLRFIKIRGSDTTLHTP